MEILPQLLVNALIAGSIYALASSGLSLTYGLLKILNFAHGHLMMVGAYCFYFWSAQQGFGLWASALLTAVFMLFLSSVCLKIFVLPFTVYSYVLSFVTTLALSTILESSVSMLFGVNVKSLTTGVEINSIEIWGIFITPIQIVIIVSALVILFLLGALIHLTPIGRRIRALSEHTFAAEGLGISKTFTSYGVFMLGTLLAAYAGILVGFETNMQPTMGNAYTIKAFAAMILGGLGNIWGTVAGSYLLGLVENLSIGLDFWGYSIPAGYKDAFAFAIILAVLLFKPKGLFLSESRAS
jgi:branched-chain amino acid transport system permease protein